MLEDMNIMILVWIITFSWSKIPPLSAKKKRIMMTKLTEYSADYEGERDYVSINTNHKGSMTRLSKNEGLNLLMLLDFKLGKVTRGNHYHKINLYINMCFIISKYVRINQINMF